MHASFGAATPLLRTGSCAKTLILLLVCGLLLPVRAQDDATMRIGLSGYDGTWMAGPAIYPMSVLNGPTSRMSGPDFSSYDFRNFSALGGLDDQLPRWLQFGLDERFRFEGYSGSGFKAGNDDSYFLNRFRFQATIRPTGWLKIVAQVQDGRPFFEKPPIGPPNENRWDLKLGYAEIGNPESNWISVRVGRQMINYNNTLIGDSQWRDQARSYDAAVVNLQKSRYRLGIFAASIVDPLSEGISHHQEGNNLCGLYGGIDRLAPNSMLEPFLLWRVEPSVAVETTARVKTGKLDEWTSGFRWKARVRNDFDYSYEVAMQRGNAGANGIQAWATTLAAGYRFSRESWEPRVFGMYDYASGDRNPADGIHETFDTIYPTAHDRLGIADQFGWQNIMALRAGVTIEPHRRWTITTQYLDFWLASATDALYNSSGGAIVRDASGHSGTHIGEEFDSYGWYEINRRLFFGFGYARVHPGEFLAHMMKGASYNYPYFSVTFKDNGRGGSIR